MKHNTIIFMKILPSIVFLKKSFNGRRTEEIGNHCYNTTRLIVLRKRISLHILLRANTPSSVYNLPAQCIMSSWGDALAAEHACCTKDVRGAWWVCCEWIPRLRFTRHDVRFSDRNIVLLYYIIMVILLLSSYLSGHFIRVSFPTAVLRALGNVLCLYYNAATDDVRFLSILRIYVAERLSYVSRAHPSQNCISHKA